MAEIFDIDINTPAPVIIQELPTERKYTAALPLGYELRADSGEYTADGIFNGLRVFQLMKGGAEVLRVSDGGQMTDADGRAKLFGLLEPYLLEAEGGEKTTWMKKIYCRFPADVPPWERETPVRRQNLTFKEARALACEDGNATRFEQECAGWLVYDSSSETWFAWCENRWAPAGDKLGRARRFVTSSLELEVAFWDKRLQTEVGRADKNSDAVKELGAFLAEMRKHTTSSKTARGQKAMCEICADSTMCINLADKKNIDIITYKNGAVDTETGKTYEIWECEQLKNLYPVIYLDRTYTKGAKPIEFISHLQTVFFDNTTVDLDEKERWVRQQELGRYFMRYLGYLLTVGNPEQIFMFLWGEGANGKTTTITSLQEALGAQMAEASCKEMYATNDDKPASGIARNLDKRALLFSEASDDEKNPNGGKFSRDTSKALSGDRDTSRFRGMWEESRRQRIVCKPIAVTNELPHFDKELDAGLLRRMVTIPFPHVFAGDERVKGMDVKLMAEADSIFSLMVDEMKEYRKHGLPELPEFCRTTQAELLAGGLYYDFLKSEYVTTDGKKPDDRTTREDLQAHFIEWCDARGRDIDTKMQLSGGVDAWGGALKERRLTKAESGRLFKAVRVMGIGESNSRGGRYFKCKIRRG